MVKSCRETEQGKRERERDRKEIIKRERGRNKKKRRSDKVNRG